MDLKEDDQKFQARMAHKRREKMTKRNKPTNKQIVQELAFLNQKIHYLENIISNYIKAFDLYIKFKKDDTKFKDHIVKETDKLNKETAKKD